MRVGSSEWPPACCPSPKVLSLICAAWSLNKWPGASGASDLPQIFAGVRCSPLFTKFTARQATGRSGLVVGASHSRTDRPDHSGGGRMRLSHFQLALLVLTLFAIAITAPAFSQGITTGTVTGTVTDPSGAVVPGAQVELTNLATGVKLDEKSAADGSFKFFLVPIGTYRALITASGFANEEVNNVQVVSGASTNLDEIKLQVASAQAQEVEVNGSAAALLETTDSQVTTTFNTETMTNLAPQQRLRYRGRADSRRGRHWRRQLLRTPTATTIPSTARAGAITTSKSMASQTTTTRSTARRYFSATRTPSSNSRSSPTITAPSMAAMPAR